MASLSPDRQSNTQRLLMPRSMQHQRSQESQSGLPSKPDNAPKESQTSIEAFWAIHGGWWAYATSPFLWSAFGLTVVCYPYWTLIENGSAVWAQAAIEIIPGLLGFSLGGMSILLALSSARLLRVIRSGGRPNSHFMKTIASFFNFIFVQTAAIGAAMVAKAHPIELVSFIGFLLMAYGAFSAIAVAINLFGIARIFNATAPFDDRDSKALCDPKRRRPIRVYQCTQKRRSQ